MQATKSSFLIGSVAGLVLAGAIYYVFTFVVFYAYGNLMLSGITLFGFGSAIGGYYTVWKGDKSPLTYFILGFGAGVVVVAFIGAGSGLSPAYYG